MLADDRQVVAAVGPPPRGGGDDADLVAGAEELLRQGPDVAVDPARHGPVVGANESDSHRTEKIRLTKLPAVALQPSVRGVTMRPRQAWRSTCQGPISSSVGWRPLMP